MIDVNIILGSHQSPVGKNPTSINSQQARSIARWIYVCSVLYIVTGESIHKCAMYTPGGAGGGGGMVMHGYTDVVIKMIQIEELKVQMPV